MAAKIVRQNNVAEVTAVLTVTLVGTTAMHPFEITPRTPSQGTYTWQVSVPIPQGFPKKNYQRWNFIMPVALLETL